MYQLLIRCLDVVKSQLRFVYEINQPDRDDLDDHIHAVLANDPVYIEALVHVGSMICNHTMPFYELLNDSVHSDLTSNFAFEGNGLQLCYLSCTRTDTTLRALYYTTVMFYNVAEYFELNELVRIVRRFVAVVFTRMLGAAPQWLKSDAQLSTELRQTVILLAKSLFPNGTEHETFELDMAFKLLQSPYLEHRLAAIVILRSYATFFIRSTTDGRRRASDNMVEVVMTADALQEWFNANDVIAHVFGANAHTEIISRCRPILRFRALGNNITPANLQALVGGVQAHHESVRLQIFTAVTEMVFAVRSPVVFEYLFQLLENIPLSEWDVLLLEFVCKCAAPALRFVSRCLTEIDASPEVRHAFYTNAEQLSHRLDLLAVVLKGGLALTRDHLDTLWRCCQTRVIDTATSVPFGEQVLFWLDALIGDTSFPKESILYLFSNRASLSPSNMSKGEFKLFTTLFVKVNFDGHKPKDDLIGLDRLWALALTCESDELAVEVNEFVIALYANFDVSHADDAEQRLSRRLEFIGRCMRCVAMATSAHNESDADIQAAVNNVLSATEDHIIPESTTEGESETSGSVTYTDISITRALTMLSQYNKQYAQDNRDKLANLTISRTGYVFEGQPLPLKICPMGQPVINLNAMTVTTIGEVRRLIATTLNVHHTALRIIASGKELKGDTQTLAQAQIKPGARLNVMVSPLVQEGGMTNENASINSPQSPADNAPPTASSAAASDVPTVILASGHYFDLLFSLLKNESAPYVGGLWALIESLPYNVDTYFAFVDLGEDSLRVKKEVGMGLVHCA
ncbi:hypothetical protein SARC_02699 [Sphaeroforma arctica JP610]|uniref:Ubiquitin-like domain-containing protein n=1 Tax=Sphaeroforma arctica JP610 TaxID=667725 RepID=A0A0L0G882_9EUKA|nr:hypothetical protein SARC_02699 [Sphaeroforma arctica JP610]KNC85109.1 hypothetical protein SARC_02699 [Sphaeroforma arctica JP610]|eukprot:XP_014159011.1 hypothetical protein SARC_02699 [Sphaeroforma arctica JP610]